MCEYQNDTYSYKLILERDIRISISAPLCHFINILIFELIKIIKRDGLKMIDDIDSRRVETERKTNLIQTLSTQKRD